MVQSMCFQTFTSFGANDFVGGWSESSKSGCRIPSERRPGRIGHARASSFVDR
jgi:hypothetical protein